MAKTTHKGYNYNNLLYVISILKQAALIRNTCRYNNKIQNIRLASTSACGLAAVTIFSMSQD